MARENKLPILETTYTGFHTNIIEEKEDSYVCRNYSTNEIIEINKNLLKFVLPEVIKEYEDTLKQTIYENYIG